ncbi:hypothetical protein ACWDTP_15460 [Mycobacterium sp. NPDC003449]
MSPQLRQHDQVDAALRGDHVGDPCHPCRRALGLVEGDLQQRDPQHPALAPVHRHTH